MLRRIATTDFSLLRSIAVELGPGLTVLTGPSGAGKTLLFDALSFALGERARRGVLSSGAAAAEVQVEIELPQESQLDASWRAGSNTIVRRLTAAGTSRLTLNGSVVTAAQLQEVAQRYVEVTGQFESRVLFDAASHLGLLDSFGESALQRERTAYSGAYAEYVRVRQALAAVRESAANRAQEAEFLRFQVDELAAAGIAAGERASVEAELKVQQNAVELARLAQAAAGLFGGDDEAAVAYDLAARGAAELDQLETLCGGRLGALKVDDLRQSAASALETLRELAAELRSAAQDVQVEPGREAQLTERLDLLLSLERKYGAAADDLPQLLTEKSARLAILTDASQTPEALESELARRESALEAVAARLTKQRQKAAKSLGDSAQSYLGRLDFPAVRFEVDIQPAGRWRADGADSIEFLVSLNPGEPPRPLAQVASGGEASRLFLALKAALAQRLDTRVMLLDEVEAGLGGDTARRVAEVLRELAETRQVLAITHLPVVAAQAQAHLVVSKAPNNNRSAVTITTADDALRRRELVRMLGSEDTAQARALVEQLLS